MGAEDFPEEETLAGQQPAGVKTRSMKYDPHIRSTECGVEAVEIPGRFISLRPPDIYETPEAFVISADVPGVDDDGTEVSLRGII